MTGPLVIWNRELFTQQRHNYWHLFSLEAFGVFIKVLHRGPLGTVSCPLFKVTLLVGVVLFGEKFSLLLARSFFFPLSRSLI